MNCEANFSMKTDLAKHIEDIHEKTKFQCLKCDAKFAKNGSLIRHVIQFHGGQKCPFCSVFFTNFKNGLKEHIATFHPEKKHLICLKCDKGVIFKDQDI